MKSLADRKRFAEGLQRVEPGMSGTDVLRLVGSPDDVRSFREESQRYQLGQGGGELEKGLPVIWAYGTSGRCTLPSWGQVWFRDAGSVYRVYGGSPFLSEAIFTEDELREELESLDSLPSIYAGQFSPKAFVRAANRLIRLGNVKANAAIQEYLRVAPLSIIYSITYPVLALVIRAVFEQATKASCKLGPPMFGGHWFGGCENLAEFPLFPLVIARDIPLMLVNDYLVMGRISIRDELSLAAHGQIRSTEFIPSSHIDGLLEEVWTRLINTGMVQPENPEEGTKFHFIATQIQRLIEDVFPVEEDRRTNLSLANAANAWQTVRLAMKSIDIEWDLQDGRYRLAAPK